MVGIFVAVLLIIFGSTMATLAPGSVPATGVRSRPARALDRLGIPGSRGATRLLGFGLMLVGGIIILSSAIVVVGVGQVGVQHFLGRVDRDPLPQGVRFINPFATVIKMSTREQGFPSDGSIEHMEAQTSEQMNVALDVAILYRLDGARAPELYQRLGTQDQIEQRIVLNAVRNGVRDAIATQSINQVFSPNRKDLAVNMKQAIQTKAGDRIEVLEVFVRDIQAPPTVRQAIESKLQREQQVAQEKFQTEIIQERARQKIEEAKGIAEAQRIVNTDLTDRYLVLRYIEALQNLPAGSLVIAPTNAGMPILVQQGGRKP
jgi:regulator of protease activity HflC (stomatin/prohibitin superfamily)